MIQKQALIIVLTQICLHQLVNLVLQFVVLKETQNLFKNKFVFCHRTIVQICFHMIDGSTLSPQI